MHTNGSTALPAIVPHSGSPSILMGSLTIAQFTEQVHLIQQAMKDLMTEGEHYGLMDFQREQDGSPKKGAKPSLFKPGAEKLGFLFRLSPSFEVEERDLPREHREVKITTTLTHLPTGLVWGQGVGCATTMETKYRWRMSERKCPACLKETIIKGKEEFGGGWLCFKKKGGCGEKFNEGDASIEKQVAGRVEHDNPADYYNTVLKIAKKRSHVDAILTATAASDFFTQDIEDLADLLGAQQHAAPEPKKESKERPVPKCAPRRSSPPRDEMAGPPPDYYDCEIPDTLRGGSHTVVDEEARGPRPEDLPPPLMNPWLHRLQLRKELADPAKGRHLFEAPNATLAKLSMPAMRNRLSPADISNIEAAIRQPELKEQARRAWLDEQEQQNEEA